MATQLTAAEADESRQPNLIALCTVMLISSTLALSLRFWSNYVAPSHHWGWDDLFAAITLPFIISETAVILWWTRLGLGKHAVTIPPADLAEGPKMIFIATIFYSCNISLPKFSALFFYHRVFERTSKWFTVARWIVGAMNAAWLVSATINVFLQCTPVNAAWEPVPGSTCISQWGWFIGTAIPSMVIDLLILIMPMPLLWRLQAPVSRRIMVGVLFLCGYCVIVVSIGRLVTLARAGSHVFDDLTWRPVGYLEWVQCEGPISLISVCLPNIFRFFRRVHEKGVKGAFPDSRGESKPSSSFTSGHYQRQFVRMEDYPSHLSTQQETYVEGTHKSQF
ncbi:uncharacterized protein F4807DRAFT_226546 [Annulohypoxylon truncatum]|uniref:uncharacterized protein n=1 Tax=Annulohypoxylon truncatum TaxID=327061 RepID=UPI0020072EC4|nr:uncharacterized protein F4807DRAFT_226546 [Annulohypoxylon truncatum]KAI1206599.1 hypothetical protein F4807DRAFT_226546 [Annulohypoxylon truncatum]